MNQWINVGTITGDILSLIRYHEGFMGQRIGPVSCMSFHPYKVQRSLLTSAGNWELPADSITQS